MTIALAASWTPRGELPRAERMADALCELYAGAWIAMPPNTAPEVIERLAALPGVQVFTDCWPSGRLESVARALHSRTDAIHYADFDRLLHWLECFPDELHRTLDRIAQVDCLVLGRTDRAWSTHPRCMIESEALFNMTFSHLVGAEMDVGAGSRGFSRRAATYLVRRTDPAWGWAVDAAWPLMLQRGGFALDYAEVEGLEWESADQGLDHAASATTRTAVAEEHDQSPEIWRQRVYVAHEIIRVGLLAAAHEANGSHD
jgi:hypothetical protein